MPEPLKNLYTTSFLSELGKEVQRVSPTFNISDFVSEVCNDQWKQMELKERMHHIARVLYQSLHGTYVERIRLLYPVAHTFDGFLYMLFPTIVELYGIDYYDTSIEALEEFTPYSSSEFAVRHFLIKYPLKMITKMVEWAHSTNHHVRRLASEGCRPRLPWAIALPEFKKNPAAILPILEILQDDESEYVRRSVANNINDIAKDNPQVTIEIANKWYGQTSQKDALIKHACRTLLKAGDKRILPLFGYEKPDHISVHSFECSEMVEMGKILHFSFNLESSHKELGLLRIEYALYFLRKNRTLSRKVFKLSESTFTQHTKNMTGRYSFKAITTRKYYPGIQEISLILNGVEVSKKEFVLKEK